MEKDWDTIDGLYQRALAEKASGRNDDAAALLKRVLALDPEDHLGAALVLAQANRKGAGLDTDTRVQPTKAPDAYVASLFDQIADRFDAILVDELGYAVPLMLADLLVETIGGEFERWLDLGCGTGLCAMALEEQTKHRVGVDLASKMLDMASDLDLYHELFHAEAVQFLATQPLQQPFDLVTAADVLPYIGDLDPLLEGLAKCTTAGSIFGFSTERLEINEPVYALGEQKRFAHSTDYLARMLDQHGWLTLTSKAIIVRTENGIPVPGDLVIARHQ
ncbi:MAG: methyltransferase [Pseudomonadota bacterium]